MQIRLLPFLFEVSICLLVFMLICLIFSKPKERHPLFFVIKAFLSLCIPLFNFASDDFLSLFEKMSLSSFDLTPLSIMYSGNLVVSVLDILSLIWLIGFTYFAFNTWDRLVIIDKDIYQFRSSTKIKSDFFTQLTLFSAYLYTFPLTHKLDIGLKSKVGATRLIDKIPLIIMELFYTLLWFHPIAWWFRNSFKNSCIIQFKQINSKKTDFTLSSNKLSYWTPFSFVAILLFFLFSFDLSNNLPYAEQFAKSEDQLSAAINTSLFDLEKSQKGTVLDWGKIDLPVTRIGNHHPINYDYNTVMMNRPYFKEIKNTEIKLYKGGEKQRITHLEALFNSPDFAEPLKAVGRDEFQKYINAISSQREVTILIKMTTELNETWFAALGITRYARLYVDHPDLKNFSGSETYFNFILKDDNPYFKTETASLDVEEKDAIYTLQWGKLKIILEKYANPNVYQGNLEIDLPTLEENIGQTIEVLKNGNTRSIKSFRLNRFDTDRGSFFDNYDQNIESIEDKFSISIDEKILKDCGLGTIFHLTLETEDILISDAQIQIIDPFKPYIPHLQAKRHKNDPAEFTFQVINLPDRKTTLRADTLLEANKRNLEIYGNSDRYEIIHIPDFKTTQRLISADNFIWWDEEEQERENQSIIFQLPEYTEHIGKAIGLWWGDLFANPNSVNLTRQELKNNSTFPLRLMSGDQELKIVEMEMVVQHQEEQPQVYFIRRKNGELRLPEFAAPETETDICVQKIVIKTDDKYYHFPLNFAFHIGKELTGYNLKINELDDIDVPFDTVINVAGKYEVRSKGKNLIDLLADQIHFNENRIRLHGAVQNPVLSIEFSSKRINTNSGKHLIWSELHKRYLFSYVSHFETLPSYRLGLLSKSKLNAYLVSAEEKKKASKKVIINGDNAVLKSATPYNLTQFLESHFNEYIYSVLDNEEAYYFSLDISSFEAVKEQLENDYGLQIVAGNFPVNFLDVNFLSPKK